jgi:hypothetical protein
MYKIYFFSVNVFDDGVVLLISLVKVQNKEISNISVPVALYGFETWSHTLREQHKLRQFENEVWKRIFGPKRVG